ncbi:MAG: hypothetical protein M1387_08065 [Thaumarchaeota archaeon]|nr:hypothetical protein [Nitrososphaerota archaeon]
MTNTANNTKPKLESVLAALADEHSLKLFKQASTELIGGRGAPEKVGLTKKQFYTRLHRLIDLGLVERSGLSYRQTTLGSMVNNLQVKPLEESLAEYWNFLAIDEIKKSEAIPRQEQEKITRSILGKTALKKYYDKDMGQSPVIRIIYTYGELVDSVLKLIQSAKNDIFLASRYYDPNVSLLLMKKFTEGVALHLLDDNPSGTTLVSRLHAAMNDPSTKSVAKAILESPKVRIGRCALEYSFMVVDGEHCQVETVNQSNPGEFNFAVEINDQQISLRMVEIFEKIMASEKTTRDTTAPLKISKNAVTSLEK